MFDLSTGPRKTIAASFVATCLVAVATIADMICGYPFAGMIGFDIVFLVSSGIVMYLACDVWRGFAPAHPFHTERSPIRHSSTLDRQSRNERIATVQKVDSALVRFVRTPSSVGALPARRPLTYHPVAHSRS
jgi:hypothetical protein